MVILSTKVVHVYILWFMCRIVGMYIYIHIIYIYIIYIILGWNGLWVCFLWYPTLMGLLPFLPPVRQSCFPLMEEPLPVKQSHHDAGGGGVWSTPNGISQNVNSSEPKKSIHRNQKVNSSEPKKTQVSISTQPSWLLLFPQIRKKCSVALWPSNPSLQLAN